MKNSRQSIFTIGLVLALAAFSMTDAQAAKKNNNKKNNNKKKLKAPPQPSKHPKVQAAQKKYDAMKDKATDARRDVMARRNDMQKLMRGTDGGSGFIMSKPIELSQAENDLNNAEAELDLIRKQLLGELDDEFYAGLLAQIQDLKDAQLAQRNSDPNGLDDPKARIQLNVRLIEAQKQLKEYELKVLSQDEAFKKALAVVEDKKKQVTELRRQMSEERKAAVASAKAAQSNNPQLIAAKDQVEQAVSVYSEAYKDQQAARKVLSTALEGATVEYKKYLIKKAAQDKKNQMDKFRNKGKRGKGKKGNNKKKKR